MSTLTKRQRRISRARKTHAKSRVSQVPRLIVFRSLKATYAQIIDDATGKIVCGASNLNGASGIPGAEAVGEAIATSAKAQKIKKVAFDRNGYKYHGRIKALADGARKGGLEF